MEVNLPKRFEEKLNSSDRKFRAIVYEILKNFEDIFISSSLEFFPEYNNHGILHLNNIFKIQDELITSLSFELLTAEDIVTLIVATLSHDIGMHLNYDGFQTLINSNLEHCKTWNEKWVKFFQLAKKYNEVKLKGLFGDTSPILELPKTKQDFKNRDYMLVGEFLRMNHPDLAEDILTYGFPVANNKFSKLSNQLENEKKILAFSSLLAKSHGMNLRDTFDEVKNIGYEDNLVFAHNIHIIYLMVILRLSDYLDIYKNRNPKIILGLKKFMSEISKFEWDKNTAIIDENPYHKDKEAIYLGVEPQNSLSFINLKSLFRGIQYELDISWAVIGEVYSRADELKNLGIKYRRISSNLDKEDTFRKTVNYIPKKIAFDSDPDLLKLLVAPLYGNDPSYGVRELLQNAVDACKEYQELVENNSSYKPNIYVNTMKEDENYFFEIIDNGLGMTEDTIINYFLKAGASFRNSDFWIEKLKDENNKSKVVITGRFGVGLLAAFLFGNKIEVKTKYYNAEVGHTFATHLSDSQINIVQDSSLNIGTSIKIEINEEIYNKLMLQPKNTYEDKDKTYWKEWYLLQDIDIHYNGIKINNTIEEKKYIQLEQDDYTSVGWSFEDKKKQLCICNGFKIPYVNIELESVIDIPYTHFGWNEYRTNHFNSPSYLIVDKEGKLPLTLSRERFLTKKFSFNDALIKSMSNALFKCLKNYKISKNKLFSEIFLNHPIMAEQTWNNTVVRNTRSFYKKFIFNKLGFNLLNSYTIEKNSLCKLVFVEFHNEENVDSNNELLKHLINTDVNVLCNYNDITANSSGYSYLLKTLDERVLDIDKKFKIKSANIFMPKEKYKKIFNFGNTYVNVGFKDSIVTSTEKIKKNKSIIPASEESDSFAKNSFIREEKSVIDLKGLDKYIDEIGLIVEMHIDYNESQKKEIEYYFYNLMEEYFKNKDNYWISYID